MDTILKQKFDVAFIATIFLDKDHNYFSGGAEIHLKNICQLLAPAKRILVFQMSDQPDSVLVKDGITIVVLHAKNRFIYKLRLSYLLTKVRIRNVHFNYFGLEQFVFKRKDTIYSATFHGTGWDFPTNIFPKPYMKTNFVNKVGAKCIKTLMILGQVRSIKKLDKILAVDTSLLRFSQQFITNQRGKISTVYNFADLNRFKPAANKSRKVFSILYPRNISYARGVHLLVPIATRLMELSTPIVIRIVGAGVNEVGGSKYERILHQEIKDNNLENAFEFQGRVSHTDMPRLYQESDLIIVPSFFSEGTSLSCIEAMAVKKIVLASNVGGLNDLITDGFNGFLASPDVESFTEKIKYIIDNFSDLNQVRENAYELVCQNNSLENWSHRVSDFFNEM